MDVCAGEQMGCPGDVSYVRLSRLSRRRLGYWGVSACLGVAELTGGVCVVWEQSWGVWIIWVESRL